MHYFLDIDGVLNKKSDWDKKFFINPQCLAAFKGLLSYDKDPVVVLSSTWRMGVSKTGDVSDSGLLSTIEKSGIHISDVTPNAPNKTRLEEIAYYARRHNIGKFVAIDDDESLFPKSEGFPLYLVDYQKGFTEKDAKNIRKMYL